MVDKGELEWTNYSGGRMDMEQEISTRISQSNFIPIIVPASHPHMFNNIYQGSD